MREREGEREKKREKERERGGEGELAPTVNKTKAIPEYILCVIVYTWRAFGSKLTNQIFPYPLLPHIVCRWCCLITVMGWHCYSVGGDRMRGPFGVVCHGGIAEADLFFT